MDLFFGFRSNEGRTKVAGGGVSINTFKEHRDKKAYTLSPRPGYKLRTQIAGSGCRGAVVVDGFLYSVHGSTVYKTSNQFVTETIGVLTTSAGKVYLRSNGFSIGIVDGTNFYDLNISTGALVTRTLPAEVNPSHLSYSQGFFYINDPDTGDLYHHLNSFDTSTWNSLDQSNAEYSPDNLIGIFDVSGNHILAGEKTTEIWVYTGNINFVIQPVQGLTYEFGIAAKHSFAKMSDAGFFLARDGGGGLQAVMMERGSGISPIGELDVIGEWSRYSRVDDAIGATVNVEGHPLWVLSYPSADKTWVYDNSVTFGSRWSEWQGHDDFFDARGRFPLQDSILFNKTQYITSPDDGGLYEISTQIHTDDSEPLIMTADSQEIDHEGEYRSHASVLIKMDTGGGLSDQTAQGHDPKIRIGYTDDHGNTWTWRDWISFGKQGEYDKEVEFRSLGRTRHRKYRVQVSDPVSFAILNPSILRTRK